MSLPILYFSDQKRELNFCNGYLSLLYFWLCVWYFINWGIWTQAKPHRDFSPFFLIYGVMEYHISTWFQKYEIDWNPTMAFWGQSYTMQKIEQISCMLKTGVKPYVNLVCFYILSKLWWYRYTFYLKDFFCPLYLNNSLSKVVLYFGFRPLATL